VCVDVGYYFVLIACLPMNKQCYVVQSLNSQKFNEYLHYYHIQRSQRPRIIFRIINQRRGERVARIDWLVGWLVVYFTTFSVNILYSVYDMVICE
jgi:hypothetical protein